MDVATSTHMNGHHNISSLNIAHKGIGANMLKMGVKRRRTKAQVDADREEEQLREESVRDVQNS